MGCLLSKEEIAAWTKLLRYTALDNQLMDTETILFACNICGSDNEISVSSAHREMLKCVTCGSNARFRGVVKAIQTFVLNDSSVPLKEHGRVSGINGIGMSDWPGYAQELERILDFQNTYYHTEPFLDVTDEVSCQKYRNLDFVISSEVLEHVGSPVTKSLEHIYNMLRPGGILVLTVPYLEGYETIEHYPHLNIFKITDTGGVFSIVNTRPDGAVEFHVNPKFHGGPGSVLEMRVFGEGDLLAMLRHTGFVEILDMPPTDRAIGYIWPLVVESDLSRGRRSKSHVLVCRKPVA